MQFNNAQISLEDSDTFDFEYNSEKKRGYISITDKFYSKLYVADMNDEQAEKLYNLLDEQLHDETYKQLEGKLIDVQIERDKYREEYLDMREQLNSLKGVNANVF